MEAIEEILMIEPPPEAQARDSTEVADAALAPTN